MAVAVSITIPTKVKMVNISEIISRAEPQRKVYIETYGCQMNVSDSEIVVSILTQNGIENSASIEEADIILVNTCSIRENAENKIWKRLEYFKKLKKTRPDLLVGVIGCMAERLKEKIIEKDKLADLVVGPDAYRELPYLITEAESGHKAINVLLSREETYADISPVRISSNKISAFVSIMRGCNNFCSYCVVPYTRGEERSRDPESILQEISQLALEGYKEITLLGQNVNSYSHKTEESGKTLCFYELLEKAAAQNPNVRLRFSTSHPRDLSNELLHTIARYPNICKHIHLPVQSGSDKVLSLMKRGYDRESYLERVNAVKAIIPECTISTDIISGFCSESEADHSDTLSLMREVGYDFAYMFKYSERDGTEAAKDLTDDVPENVKTRRLNEIIELQGELSSKSKRADVGKVVTVLVEGKSKKSDKDMFGRTSQNKVVVFPANLHSPGEYSDILIQRYTSATLIGIPV